MHGRHRRRTASPYANNDDGSCVFEPCGTAGGDCPFDSNGDGEIGSADLLDFLVRFGQTGSERIASHNDLEHDKEALVSPRAGAFLLAKSRHHT